MNQPAAGAPPQVFLVPGSDEIALWSEYNAANLARSKAVPGYRFESADKTFRWPANPQLAPQLAEAWRGQGLRADSGFLELLQAGKASLQRMEAVQAAKTAADPDPIPVTNKDGWPHQRRGFQFFRELPGAIIGFDMGLGKTYMTVALIADDTAQGHTDPILILTPNKDVTDAWAGTRERASQFDQHLTPEERQHYDLCPLTTDHTAKQKQVLAERAVTRAHHAGRRAVILVNYDTWRQPTFLNWTMKVQWGLVALDECHRLKDPGGTTSKAVARLRSRSRRVYGLTGTVAPHNPLDIYAQMRAVDPVLFGTNYNSFKAKYAKLGGYMGREVVGYQNEAELQRKLHSRAMIIKKSDPEVAATLQLPPVLPDIYRTFDLSPQARRIYDTLAQKLIAKIEGGHGGITVANALVKLLRLAQITGGWVPLDVEEGEDYEEAEDRLYQIDTGKADALTAAFDELRPEEPIVAFCRFRTDLDTVHAAAAKLKRGSLELSGPRKELGQWQADRGDYPILAVQEQAGGVGVDATRACYGFYVSKGFSLGNYDQTRARLDRPGQTRPVTFVHMMARNTIDERIMRALDLRRQVVEEVLAELKAERKAA